MFYNGSGLTTNPSTNPGAPTAYMAWYPIVNTTFDAGLSDCEAIMQCANTTATGNTEVYASFDVHLLSGIGWTCVQYFSGNSDTSSFNVVDGTVEVAYGFTY